MLRGVEQPGQLPFQRVVFIHGEEWSIYGPELGEFEKCGRQVSVSPVLASVVYP